MEQKQKLIVMRFRKALRKNDSTMLQRCLESGYKPAIQEWLCIIGKMHVATALACVSLSRTLETPCIAAAIRRQHKKLFKEVMSGTNLAVLSASYKGKSKTLAVSLIDDLAAIVP